MAGTVLFCFEIYLVIMNSNEKAGGRSYSKSVLNHF